MVKILGKEQIIPWEEKPEGCKDVLWRSEKNPIISPKQVPNANSIFNSAVIPYGDGYAGIFRVDNKEREMRLHSGKSFDGINWLISETPICAIDSQGEENVIIGYDPRVCEIDGVYYIPFCNCIDGPTVGILYTRNFIEFFDVGNAFLPFNRNGVIFPRKINGKYAMLSRPSDNGHTPFGNIYYSESPDLEYWGHHKLVMETTQGWQSLKIGAGPVPIETTQGWLVIYHGVLLSCNGYVYSAGAAILDTDEPWKVKYRCKPYIIAPKEDYERTGDVPNVVFPCGALADPKTGRIALYYGGADTVVCLAYTMVEELVEYIIDNSYGK